MTLIYLKEPENLIDHLTMNGYHLQVKQQAAYLVLNPIIGASYNMIVIWGVERRTLCSNNFAFTQVYLLRCLQSDITVTI